MVKTVLASFFIALFILALMSGCFYSLTLYAQFLEGKKESALSEQQELKVRAEHLQTLADETVSLRQKANLTEELTLSRRPLSEWLQVIENTASANRISTSKISFDHKGSYSVEGESPEMQQIAIFNDQLCNLDFLSQSQVKTITMTDDNKYHFKVYGMVAEVGDRANND